MKHSGEWNAYVEAGDTPEDRRKRLAEVPEQYRAGAENHVKTVFAIRAYHKRMNFMRRAKRGET